MFNLNKTIEVHCYTFRKISADNFGVKEMKTHRPKWFKDTSTKMTNTKWNIPQSSIKNCHGIINLFKQSFYLPLWTDLHILNETHGLTAKIKDPDTTTEKLLERENSQAPALSQYNRHIKIDAPWFFQCDKDINFYINGASWDYVNNSLYNFHLPPGIVDFKHQHSINTQWLFPIPITKEQETCTSFQAGDPIYYLTPLTDKKIKFISHHISRMEYYNKFDELDSISPFWVNAYQKAKKLKIGKKYKGYRQE